MRILLCTTAMTLALGLTPVFAQTAATPAPTSPAATSPGATAGAQISDQDRTFANKAAQGGMAEVELGRLATKNATNADVKAFAQKMIDDHTQANDKLKAIAQRKSITLPNTLDAEHQRGHDQMMALKGEQFDRHYVEMMVRDHQKTVDLFRTQTNSGSDADLKSFAQQTLPTLEAHLKTAQDLNRTMQPMAGASTTPVTAAAATATAPTIDMKLGQMKTRDLIGKDVVNARGQEVGEIENVVMGTDRTLHAVIGVGGFLGLGEKDVMLPLHQLRVGSNDAILMSDMSEDALKQLPEYKKDGFEELPRDRRLVE